MNEKSIKEQFADTMLEVGSNDSNLVVLVGDIGHFILQPFAKKCPGRYYNIGICEPTMISMAAGLSRMGFYPVVHTIAPFIIERSFEQLKLDFCYQKLGGNLVTVGSAFDYSNLGCTHHCYGDFAMLKLLQGTEIVYPSSPIEFDRLFKQTYKNDKLTLLRVPAKQHGYSFNDDEINIGKGLKVTEGNNLTIVVTGPQLKNVMDARDELLNLGFDTEIIYIHTILPLDIDIILESVKKTRRVIVVEEHMRNGGLGDDILRIVAELDGLQFSSVSIPNQFIHGYGSYEDLCAKVGLNKEGIIAKVREDFMKKPD